MVEEHAIDVAYSNLVDEAERSYREMDVIVIARRASEPVGSSTTIDEKIRCHECLDVVPVSDAVTLSSCGHRFCGACLRQFLQLKVSEGVVNPVCFHPNEETGACGVPLSADDIRALVDSDVWAKYEYFHLIKNHTYAREYPHCSHAQNCAGPEEPSCVCESCAKPFCLFHGNAHDGSSCADYELKAAREDALSRSKILEIAKPCPGCGRSVEKNGGCNHMTCIVCGVDFCWLCCEALESATDHYGSENEGGCRGMQFFDSSELNRLNQCDLPPDGDEVCFDTAVRVLRALFFLPACALLLVVAPLTYWLWDDGVSLRDGLSATQDVLAYCVVAVYALALLACRWARDSATKIAACWTRPR